MKEEKLKIAQNDIEEALSAIESLEKELDNQPTSKDSIKEKFIFLSEKMKDLEFILKNEGIL